MHRETPSFGAVNYREIDQAAVRVRLGTPQQNEKHESSPRIHFLSFLGYGYRPNGEPLQRETKARWKRVSA